VQVSGLAQGVPAGSAAEIKGKDRKPTGLAGAGVRVSEELAPKSMRDEIIQSFYASLDYQLGYFILVA